MPDISILMSFYNAVPFLRECLDSALAQSETSWEFILVNNHSTDSGPAIAREYSLKDPRFRVFENEGKGIIPALRTAYAQARGRLITRMDADDIMAGNKLSALRKELERQGPGHLATGLVSYFSHEGPVGNGYTRYAAWLNKLTSLGENFRDIYRECVIPSPCWMAYREDLDRSGAFSADVYPEDYDLCFRFYRAGLKVASVREVLHHWRDYSSRTSRNDPRYANPFYFDLKLPWFCKLEYEKDHELVLWGGGGKGKTIAKWLNQNQYPFRWVVGNSSKQGQTIYGRKIEPASIIEDLDNPLVIIAVSMPAVQEKMRAFLNGIGLSRGKHYFFFC
jgi:glycosyltransferase involved in cell wall biosynthesis